MDQNLQQILEQQLRDVHLPEPISWWPLAYGWWLLMVLCLLAIAASVVLLIKTKRRNRYRKDALLELKKCYSLWQKNQNTVLYLQSVNAVLKRSIQHSDGASYMLRLSGADWVTGLNKLVVKPLSEHTQEALSVHCYQESPETDVDDVQANALEWVKSHKASLLDQTKQTGGAHA